MGRGSGAGGKVRWDIKQLPMPPKPEAIEKIAAEHIAKRLIAELRSAPSKFSGLATWLINNIEVRGSVIKLPSSAAVERMGLTKIERVWLDEALTKALKAKPR